MTEPVDGMVVHENENYKVIVSDELELQFYNNTYLGGYEVVNKMTGLTEFMATSMPEALYNAEHLNAALVSRAWEWRSEKADEKVISPLASALN